MQCSWVMIKDIRFYIPQVNMDNLKEKSGHEAITLENLEGVLLVCSLVASAALGCNSTDI